MLRLERGADPDVYPETERRIAIAALWSAWPALLVSPTGRIDAVNQLTRWVTGLSSASLLDLTILELSAQLLGSQRAPAACNPSFILKKIENIRKLPTGRQQIMAVFMEHYEEALQGSSAPIEVASCPITRSTQQFDERTPWHYPLFIQTGPDDGESRLLEFAVAEATIPSGSPSRNHYLIMLDPAEDKTSEIVAKIYDGWKRRFPGEAYVVTRGKRIDVTLPDRYNRRTLRNPKIAIVYLDDVRNAERSIENKREAGRDPTAKQRDIAPDPFAALSGAPLFEFRPRQPLSDGDLHRIAQAMEAEPIPLPRHPELGEGTGFRLSGAAPLGRVTQVDIFLGRSQAKSAAVRVHRVDDFGEPQAPRYRFDVGYLREGDAPALLFRAPEQGQQRVITVFKDGRLDEATGVPRPSSAALPVREERFLAGLPPMLGVTEVAELLGLSRAAVLAAIDRGRLAANKAEGRWEIAREDVAAYRQSTAHRRGKSGPRGKRSQAA